MEKYIYAYIGTVQCNVYMYSNRSEETPSGGYKRIKIYKKKVPKALHVWLTVEQVDFIVS